MLYGSMYRSSQSLKSRTWEVKRMRRGHSITRWQNLDRQKYFAEEIMARSKERKTGEVKREKDEGEMYSRRRNKSEMWKILYHLYAKIFHSYKESDWFKEVVTWFIADMLPIWGMYIFLNMLPELGF